MQRWILIALVGAILFGLGGGYALWTYRENRPQKVWVPLPLNEEISEEKRKEVAEEIKKKVLEGDLLSVVVKEVGLARQLGLDSDAEAEKELRQRFFVDLGEADLPDGKRVPALHVGVNAQRKSFKAMGDAAMRIMQDVWKMLGIKPPADGAI